MGGYALFDDGSSNNNSSNNDNNSLWNVKPYKTHVKLYYTKIINDRTYLNKWLKVFPKYLGLKYYPKIKNKMNQYVYPTISLPISVKEPKNYKLLKMSTDKM